MNEHPVEHGPVECGQNAVDRVGGFGGDTTADQIPHQHRHQRDRQDRGRRHRISLGECKRRKQSALLALQRKHGHERQRDDHEAQEQRRPDFGGGVPDHRPARRTLWLLTGMIMRPAFEMFVRILDHNDRGVDHRANRNRDAAQRHDIGVDPLRPHHDERGKNTERKRDDRNQRRSRVPQEQRANDRDHDEFFDQLAGQVVDGSADER